MVQAYRFNGKESQEFAGLPYIDYGARYYHPLSSRCTTMDPMAEKYYSVSPYAFCSGNPVNFVDWDGKRVWPRGNSELEMIKRTLPAEDREYVVLGDNGYINHDVLSEHNSNSENYKSLLTLSGTNETVFVLENDSFAYKSNGSIDSYPMNYNGIDEKLIGNADGQGVGTVAGDSGLLGKTLLPDDAAIQRSPDSNIYVIVNSGMSDMSKTEMFAHEGYGHAAVYILTGSHDQATHDYKNIDGEFKDMNRYLFELINRAMNEVINNNK